MKPGIKTTEFWFSLAAFAVGAVLMFWPGGEQNVIVGGIIAGLAKLGYTVPRGLAKAAQVKALPPAGAP